MQGVFTKFLQLWIPNKTDKGTVVTDVFEPNFTKLDQNAESNNETLTNLSNNKLDKGTYPGDASDLNTEISKIASTTQLGRIIVGDNLTIDEDGILSGKKFGLLEGEVLEGHRLAQSLGLEFAGELNNNNLKQAGKAYYDTLNKSIYKCLVDNTTDYADTSKFEAISNDDLLSKLQNLSISYKFVDNITKTEVMALKIPVPNNDFFGIAFARVFDPSHKYSNRIAVSVLRTPDDYLDFSYPDDFPDTAKGTLWIYIFNIPFKYL